METIFSPKHIISNFLHYHNSTPNAYYREWEIFLFSRVYRGIKEFPCKRLMQLIPKAL